MPPKDFTSLAQQVWKAVITLRCSSGSRRVESALDPTMSQNMMVSWRRSADGAFGVRGSSEARRVTSDAEARFAPHSEQNFALTGLG
jgi:hypothetical protein